MAGTPHLSGTRTPARIVSLLVKTLSMPGQMSLTLCLLFLAGCGSPLPPIPPAPVASTGTPPDARALFEACLAAHGGAAAYERLHDVNVRFSSHWASIGPKLQPKLSDTGYREGSEEWYHAMPGGWTVEQIHRGPKGVKHVLRIPSKTIVVNYSGNSTFSTDPEVNQAASLVTDAYSMFLFGPDFFRRRGARFQRLDRTDDVDGHVCDKLFTVLRPGLGLSKEDRVVLSIDRQSHLLLRVQFTLDALESTRGAEVQVDLSGHKPLAGVMFPTEYYEHIDRPVNLDAHRWQLLDFAANRGHSAEFPTGQR